MANGCTSIHPNEPDNWDILTSLAQKGELPIRVFYCAYYKNRDLPHFPRAGERHGDMLSCDRVKIIADGTLGGSTAALSKPYLGTSNTGVLI